MTNVFFNVLTMKIQTSLAAILFFLSSSFLFGQASRIEEVDTLFYFAQGSPVQYPDSAIALGEKIQILSRELSYDWGIVQGNLVKGMALYQKNELDSAAQMLMKVISDAEFSKTLTFEEARARNVLGLIFQRLNSFDKARENFVRSAEIFQALDNEFYYAMSLSNIGVDHGMRGEYGEALEIFIKFRDIILNGDVPEKNVKKNLSSALANIGNCYSFMGNHEKALRFAKQGLKLNAESGDSVSFARSHLMVGESFAAAGQMDSAIYYNQLGVDISLSKYIEKPRYTEIVFNGQQNIAAYYAKNNQLDEAIDLLLSSMTLRKENENYGLEDCYTLLAQYHQEFNRIDSASYYSQKALKMAQANRNKRTARGAAERLASLFRKQTQFDSAYFYQSLYHVYNDSIYNDSNQRKFNNLQIELATSEKQKEIEILLKQKEIDQTKSKILRIHVISIFSLSVVLSILLYYRNKNKQKKQKIAELELKRAIEKRELELQQQTLHMINLNNSISEVEDRLKEVKKQDSVSKQDVQKVLSNITISKSMDKEWQQFESYFSNIHPKFNGLLVKQHSNLTQQERRLTALIRMGLSNREIASLLNIEQRSVIMNRYRLKQKLGLLEEEDLNVYIQQF